MKKNLIALIKKMHQNNDFIKYSYLYNFASKLNQKNDIEISRNCFQALIEKDWLAFGHKFSERCGHVQGESKEISPIFTQLLDATWQLIQQFPSTFQFNERFLLTLHDHVQSCQYGTFIGNCEKDRIDLR